MADWPLPLTFQALDDVGADTTASVGTVATSSASANTKGSWAQLIASTDMPADGFLLHVENPSAVTKDYLVDIAVGGAGSEQVILSNLLVTVRNTNGYAHTGIPFFGPHIPAGSRISARVQSNNAGAVTVQVSMTLLSANFITTGLGGQLISTLGASTADSGGVNVDPGTAANTKGAWSELSSSTPARFNQILLVIGNQSQSARAIANFLLDVGVGAAGSEQVIVPNLAFLQSSSTVPFPLWFFVPVGVPSGSRLAVRAQCSITGATRVFDAAVYGLS